MQEMKVASLTQEQIDRFGQMVVVEDASAKELADLNRFLKVEEKDHTAKIMVRR